MSTLERAGAHPMARVGKLADRADDMDLARIAQPSARVLVHLERYRRAVERQGGAP